MKKMYYVLLALAVTFVTLPVTAQYTSIPDANFRAALTTHNGIVFGGEDNEYALTADIIKVKYLSSMSEKNISDLTGIEDFTALEFLACNNNKLTTLDLSKNLKLRVLYCGNNNLTSLDLSNNTALESLECDKTSLTTLDVTNNPKLWNLVCYDNTLTSLDVRNGTNTILQRLNAERNPDLTCIYVDDKEAAELKWAAELSTWTKDKAAQYANSEAHCTELLSEKTYIPDANFRQALTTLGVTGIVGDSVPTAQISGITVLDISYKNISNLTGIEDFAALKELNCYTNQLTTLDVSKNLKLSKLICAANNLTSLDVSKNTALTYLQCHTNNFTTLDVSNNPNLSYVGCANNALLTSVDVRNDNNTILVNLYAKDNPNLSCIFVDDKEAAIPAGWSKDNSAQYVNDETQCAALLEDKTYIPDANFRAALRDSYGVVFDGEYATTSTISGIAFLNIPNKNISDLTGIEYFTALDTLQCDGNQLTTLDLSSNTELKILACHNNNLTDLDVSKNTKLEIFFCDANALTSLDVRNGTNDIIRVFMADGNPDLNCIYVDDKEAPYLLEWDKDASTYFANTEAQCNELHSVKTYMPDANFRQVLTDMGITGIVGDSVPTINITEITDLILTNKNISDLTGIEDFAALKKLHCDNNQLTTLELSKNLALEELLCGYNLLTSLDVSNNTALELIFCFNNKFTTFDVSKNSNLWMLACQDNQLTSVDVRNGNNGILMNFYAHKNPDLRCIYVDDKEAEIPASWLKDETTIYVNNESECEVATSVKSTLEAAISIYPNPTTGIVHLNLAGKSIQNLKMVDVTGKIISEKNHVNSTETIDLSNFSNGLYLVILQSENGTQSFKVVKE